MSQLASQSLIESAEQLRDSSERLTFDLPVAYVYNPLNYAWTAHAEYLKRYAHASCEVLFLGMNPGPWGMAQTGVPFGEIQAVSQWMQISTPVDHPPHEHPKRPIEGFECQRSEVSGRRLWGLFAERYPDPKTFFTKHFVMNYCPLVFMEESARNLTPDKLPKAKQAELQQICDTHLAQVIDSLNPQWLVGVGGYAHACLARVAKKEIGTKRSLGKILHPSPASPAANRGWAEAASKQLIELGIWSS